jgi:multisubunit Na+/H+ antiporter MnhB subunit
MKAVDTFILRAAIGLIFLLVNIVSIYILLRGHNFPGGGFVGGLMTGISFILLGMVRGWRQLQDELPLPPLRLASFGVLVAVLTGLAPMFAGRPFLTHYSLHLDVPLLGELNIGTPLVFDFGVFLLVSGITVKLLIVLARTTSGLPAFTRGEIPYYASVLEDPIESSVQEEQDDAD